MRSLIKLIVGCAAAIIVVGSFFLAFHPQDARTPRSAAADGNSPVPVLVALATVEDVSIILRGLGAVTAFNTVAVRSRVEGNITRINFSEGQKVKAGDLLIERLSPLNLSPAPMRGFSFGRPPQPFGSK